MYKSTVEEANKAKQKVTESLLKAKQIQKTYGLDVDDA
jgi:hypothetical protein